MKIIEKLGGVKAVYAVLVENGWNKSFSTFNMQVFRNSLSKEVCLILVKHLENLNIPYNLQDFGS